MSRTSTALKRLGVAGVVAATIGAGVPAFFAGAASAAVTQPTGITLSPDSDTAALGTCNAFTAQVTPAPGTGNTAVVDVTISQTGPSGTSNVGPNIGFCNPGTAAQGGGTNAQPSGAGGTLADPTAGPGTNVNSQPGGAGNQIDCTNPTAATAGAGTTTTCNAEFNADANGVVTFGVYSDTVGQMSVTAYLDRSATPVNDNNNVPNTGEPSDTSTKTWVANNVPASGLDCNPETSTQRIGVEPTFTCTATVSGGYTSSGQTINWVVTSGPDVTDSGTCGVTDNVGQTQCTVPNNNLEPGTDKIVFYIDQLNGGAANGPQNGEPQDEVLATFTGNARNIDCTPKTATNTAGTSHVVTCVVKDVNGLAVQGQQVAFSESGPGHIVSPTTQNTGGASMNGANIGLTDASGSVDVVTQTTQSETGNESITGTIAFGCGGAFGGYVGCQSAAETGTAQECQQPAGSTVNSAGTVVAAPSGSGTTAGNCANTVQKIWVTSAPPSSPPASSPAGGRANPTLTVNTPTINAGESASLTGTGAAGQQYQLQCYTRPSTTYFTARQGTFDSAGSSVQFTLNLGRNTRCFLQYATAPAQASPSVVVNVRTVLSLSTVRNGVRDYTFQGRNLPRVGGQLLTLYRIANGARIRTSTVYTDATGTWHIRRVFTGTGTFQFQVSTTQTLNNAAGSSNVITVTVR